MQQSKQPQSQSAIQSQSSIQPQDQFSLSFNELKEYLENFKFIECEQNHLLVQKSFKAKRDVASIGTTWEDCQLVITVDDFLLIYDQRKKTGNIKITDKKMNLDKVKPQKHKSKENQIFIIETVPGVIFNSTNKQLLKFNNKDDMLEFLMYLKRYHPEDEIFQRID